MKAEFLDYFDDIGISRVLVDRVRHFIDIYSVILPEVEMEGVFIANAEDEDNRPVFQSLWFWDSTHLFECHDFQSEEKFDATRATGSQYWRVTMQNYAFGGEPTAASRLEVISSFPHSIAGQLAATGKNCVYLERFFRARLLQMA